jgi:glyoxylase-like metal-dependent hydrolase (beta-lactamase superfamily II)
VCYTGTSAQNARDLPFTLEQVGPNIWAAISNPKSSASAGANTGFIIGDDGVAIVDTTVAFGTDGTFSSEPARQLLSAIRRMTRLPIRFVINTHHHFDHAGANGVFVEAGATAFSHQNVRRWIHGENLRLLGAAIKPAQKAFIDALVPPTVTYDRTTVLYLGSREIRLQSYPGHTGGDSVVVIADAKVVFTGDLFWSNILPNLIDASTQPWIDTLNALSKDHGGAVFVPGHGEVGTARDVTAFRDYLATLRKLVSDAQLSAQPSVVDAVMPALSDRYKSWDGFQYLAQPNILDVDAELRGKKRVPADSAP